MWSTTTKQISLNGNVRVSVGGASAPVPLQGVLVDVYRVWAGSDGVFQAQLLSQVAARTTTTGGFSFTNLPVPVQTQMVIPATPPYTPIEITNSMSLPTLAFRISVEANVLLAGTASQGNQFVEVYDERTDVDSSWLAAHPGRLHVPLSAGAAINVLIPEGDPEAMTLAGLVLPASSVTGKKFNFLRIGRAIRDEVGELGDPRPDFANRAGYMTSTDVQTPSSPSFFPGVQDAPFSGQLQIGGHFGSDFLVAPFVDELYYTVSFWDYTGSPSSPFNGTLLTNERRVQDPLFNKKYLLPTAAMPSGQWQTLNLGPFNGTITAVESAHPAALIGSSVQVYKRPPLPDLATEYWPFWDLIAMWNSAAAPNDLIIMTLEAYRRTGGPDTNPDLTKLNMDPSVNAHLPFHIDNRPPVLRLFDWRTGVARFTPSPNDVVAIAPFDPCGEMPVSVGQTDRNECILLKYSVEDGAGGAHPHVLSYGLGVAFSPRQVAGAPLEAAVNLRTFLGGGLYQSIGGSYSPTLPTAPVFNVVNYESVLVPTALDGWPPEPNGDTWSGGSPCAQYAVEVGMSCSVRTVDGWGRTFSSPSLSRHLIVKR
jgi:hypothetical protein